MPAVSATDPRVKRTRQRLQEALVELLAEKSFDAITVQDIAARSTINRATFYAHFADKQALFASFTREWFRQALRRRVGDDAGFTHSNLRLLILASMEAVAEMDDHCHPTETMKPVMMSAVQEELSALLLDWLERAPVARPEPAVPLAMSAAGLSWAIFGTALDWSRMTERSPAERTASHVADLLTAGLARVLGDVKD
ncbi:MAG TPA: TetR/AcrR family transcriptional regulator [Chloroflexota bacterium]|nr:TetR/AcrR family transcriptional regulator [Chloroflexota bacterium]